MAESFVNGSTCTSYEDFWYLTHKIDVKNEEIIECYEKHAEHYEDSATGGGATVTAQYFAKHARRLNLGQDAAIIDIGCGTGRIGMALKYKYGFNNIHGVDPSNGMLEKAKASNAYKDISLAKLGNGSKLNIEDNTYDAALLGTAVCPGHMPLDGFMEILRVVKPGGLVVNSMREQWARTSPDYDVNTVFTRWQMEGRWTLKEWALVEKIIHQDNDVLVQVYQVSTK